RIWRRSRPGGRRVGRRRTSGGWGRHCSTRWRASRRSIVGARSRPWPRGSTGPRRPRALPPIITAPLAKDPTARPSGPKVRAWLDWLLIVGLSAQPAENLRTRRPGDTGPVAPPQSAAKPTAAPAPPVPGRAGRRLLGVVSLLLLGGILVAWLTGVLSAGGSEDRPAPPPTTADAAVSPGQEQAAPASTRPASSTTRTPPTTRAPTTSAAVRGGLPAGWRAFTNRAGNDRVG